MIHNDGKLLNKDKAITIIPTLDNNYINDFLFIDISDSLSLMNIFGETIWGVKINGWVDLNSYELYADNNNITITYYQFGIVDTVIIDINTYPHQIIKDTGLLPISVEDIEFNKVGKEYQISNGLLLTLNSISTEKDGEMGALYYNIDYSLKNNSQEIINEGRFALLFKDKSGGVYQFGAFKELLPDESITKSYKFTVLEEKPVIVLAYVGLISTIEPLYWELPAE